MSQTRALWRERENSLLIGSPLVLLGAIAILPTLAYLIVTPSFAHARAIGCTLIPVYAIAEIVGLGKLAFCLRRQFDVISFFAVGTIIVFLVIALFTGVFMVGFIFPF